MVITNKLKPIIKLIGMGSLIVLLLSMSISALPNYKLMSYKLNNSVCLNVIKSIDARYYQGIKRINFYPEFSNNVYGGMYYAGGVINIYTGCDETTLVHELAHHQQYLNHESSYRYPHNSIFENYEKEIENNAL